MRAQSKDHIPPISWLYCLGAQFFDGGPLPPVWVPACLECNSALGSKKLFTIRERTLYLVGYYTKRYERLLRGESWQDWEIEELSGNLKRDMISWSELQRVIDRRIGILEENLSLR